jgi:hypothetical protein
MQIIRRLYLYSVSLVSIEVVLWGSIGLLRSLFAGQELGGGVNRLAGAISLLLVGIPVFLIHWIFVQRSIARDIDERSSRIRAIFLYLVLLVTIIPIAQNILSFLDHTFLQILGLDPQQAMFGGDQIWSDNLVAILANAIAAFYFYRVLQRDWQSGVEGDAFVETRRFYRYIWLIYGLLLVVFGLQQLVQFMLTVWSAVGETVQTQLSNGLALLIVGLPIWIYSGILIQQSLKDKFERDSLLRLVVLYILVFTGFGVTLVAAGLVIYQVLRIILGAPFLIVSLLQAIAQPFSLLVSFGLIWIYYGRLLGAELRGGIQSGDVDDTPDHQNIEYQQRKAGLRRLYYYALAFAGLLALFIGLQVMLATLLDLGFGTNLIGDTAFENQLAAALASIIIGLPVWVFHWRFMIKESSQTGDAGDYARRSLVRKTYLYLILFAGVLGVMFSAGSAIYEILRSVLGDHSENLLLDVLQQLKTLLLFVSVLIYHWWVLREDGRMAERSLAKRYAQYPVLILEQESGNFGEVFSITLQKTIPGIPVAIHNASQGVPDATLSSARALILPAELANRPSESVRLWLQNFSGEKLVIATPAEGWFWIPSTTNSLASLARQAARGIRQLAEGQDVESTREYPVLTIVAYILAGLFILELILGLIGLIGSLLFS